LIFPYFRGSSLNSRAEFKGFLFFPRFFKNKGGPENPKAKRQQTNLSNPDNWFISFSPLASFFLEDEHYGRIHCKFHFSTPAR
jgi:hypothetical protein